MNICTLCDEHKSHKKIYFGDIIPNKDEVIKNKNLLKKYIDSFTNNVKIIINILNEVINKMNIYYKLNENIINNSYNKNRNFEIEYNVNKIINSNNIIIKELKEIIDDNNIINKFNNIFNIYSKMNINEINIKYKVNNKDIKLFGDYFVNKNKNNCKIEIEGKEYDLKEKYSFSLFKIKQDILEIKLKGIVNITDMKDMFRGCSSLICLPDISNWNTSKVTNMSEMFSYCQSLVSLPDISNWNTSNVTNMSCMFYECKSLTVLEYFK